MTTATAASLTITDIVAEDAPLGVQLWPTRSPEYAPNFTLESVTVIRRPEGVRVVWTYENGTTRHFRAGEIIACHLPA